MSEGKGCLRVALVAGTTFTGGDVLSLANPEGADLIITRFIINITTAATGTPSANAGVAADGVTSSDNLIDGCAIGSAVAHFDNADSTLAGTNGRASQPWDSDEYVTVTPSASAVGLVGYAYIEYIRV